MQGLVDHVRAAFGLADWWQTGSTTFKRLRNHLSISELGILTLLVGNGGVDVDGNRRNWSTWVFCFLSRSIVHAKKGEIVLMWLELMTR